MTELTQLTSEVDTLTEEVRQLKNLMAMFMVNGLQDAFDGTGNQTYGGGKGQLSRNGIQAVVGNSVGTKYFYLYLVSALDKDPANTLPLLAHGAYRSATAIQDDVSAYLTAGNYGRTFVYADTVPEQRAGAEAARGATIARGFANIGSTDDGHFKVEPALLFASLTADPTGLADGMVWYRSDTDTFHVRANGATKTVTVA